MMLTGLARGVLRVVAVVDFLLMTVVMYALAWLPSNLTRGWYSRWWFTAWCRSFVRALGVDLRLHQHNRGPLPAQYILIANHPSAFEDIGIPALFPVASVAKREVADWWIVGRISRAAGTIYFDREDRDDRKAVSDRMLEALVEGRSIAIYPEGGCKGRRLHERFLFGAFDVAQRSGVPVLPVFLHYEAQEDFEWLGQALPTKIWQIATSSNPRANYHLFDPIEPGDFESKEAMTEHVYARYLEWQARFLD